MATAMERKFTGLRKRLDQLGYRQPLGVESVPLVERVVADLLHTTESLKICKLQVVKNKEQKGLWQQHVQPYRHDNARLTQENLELHQKLLKVKESSENRNKDLKIALRRLEHENNDLKFLNTQYMQKLLNKEKESQAKSERILQLQEKNSQAVIHTPGGKKKQIAFRKQRMDIDSTVPDSVVSYKKRLPHSEPYVADLVKVADGNIIKLREEIIAKDKEKINMTSTIEDLKKQVDRREKEIDRLASQLRGGRPPEALAMEGKIDGNERMVAHLNIQVDFLQKANAELEKQVTNEKEDNIKLKERVDELGDKNSHICTELQEIGELVKVMEKERIDNEMKLNKECNEWRSRLQEYKEREKIEEKEKTEKIKGYGELLADNREMARLLSTSQRDTDEVTSLIETLTGENRLMKKQIYEMKDAERKMKDTMKKLEATSKKKPCYDPRQFLTVQKERDELKQTVREIELQLMQIQEDAGSLTQDRNNFKILYEQVNKDLNNIRRGSKGEVPRALQRIQGERDDARLEIQQLRLECESLRERVRLAKEGNERVAEDEEDRLIILSQEVDEVTDERDNLVKRLETLQELIKHLEDELQQSKESLTQSLDDNRILQNKLHTVQGLMDAVERKKSEQQKGLQQQVVNTEAAQDEIGQLKSIIYQLEEDMKNSREKERELMDSLRQLDQQYDELRIDCDKKDEEIVQLRTKENEISNECAQLSVRMGQLSNTESSTQVQLKAKDGEIVGIRHRLSVKEQELSHLQINSKEMETQILQLKEDLTTMTRENQAMHAELRKIFEEREHLRDNMDTCGKNALKYEELLTAKEQEKAELMESYKALSDEVERLDHTVRYSREQELSWQLELTNLKKEKQQLEELCQQQRAEIEQHISTLHSYELQLSNLTNALSRMEHTIRQEEDEKKALLMDLSSVRELCVQIEKTKESMSRQLASQSVTHDQTCLDINDISAERDLLKQQFTAEQSKTDSLEALLSHQRKKEFQSEAFDKERDIEIQHLKQQITRLETDNISHKEQVHRLRSDINIKVEELERLKAELTAEKFQKKHIQEQVNKLRTAVGGTKTTPPPIRGPLSPRTMHIATSQQQLDEAIEKSKENISSESARLIDQLMVSSSS